MTDGHRGHLSASLSSLEETVRHMTEVGRAGRSPSNGQKLTPLPEQDWNVVADALGRAVQRLVDAVRDLAPECLAEREHAEGLSGTLFRLSILLRNAEEQIADDLEPSRVEAKFGALTERERQILAMTADGLRADFRQARDRLNSLNRP